VRNMPGDRSREYRRLASGCLALARQNSDLQARASLLIMAQRWLDLAELAEHNAYNRSLQRLAVQAAIGEELKALCGPSRRLPPHLLALLAQLNAEERPQRPLGRTHRGGREGS
jgi:hypothetical protein